MIHRQAIRSRLDRIRQILLKEWDPIGVSDVPEAQDEYDAYAGPIYSLLDSGVPRDSLASHLWRIETDYMGLTGGNRSHTEAIANRLLEEWKAMVRDC